MSWKFLVHSLLIVLLFLPISGDSPGKTRDSPGIESVSSKARPRLFPQGVIAVNSTNEPRPPNLDPVVPVPTGHIPTPSEIVAELDRHVIGQEKAKRTLASAIYAHYFTLQALKPGDPFKPARILLAGPTGAGKTLLVKTVAQFLKKPFAYLPLSTVTSPGYIGAKLEYALQDLARQAGLLSRGEQGVMFGDEFDKIRRNNGAGLDVTGLKVQQDLLPYLDGSRITYSGEDHSAKQFDTSKTVIILAGAFEDFWARKTDDRVFGFPGTSTFEADNQSGPTDVTPQMLIDFGFMEEVVGRITSIATLNQLDEQALLHILADSHGSPVALKKFFFGLHGIELLFTDEAMRHIAKEAIQSGTGARDLARLVNKALAQTEWQLPELREEGTKAIVVTEVRGGLKVKTDSPVRIQRIKKRKGASVGVSPRLSRATASLSLLVSGNRPAGGKPLKDVSDDEKSVKGTRRDRPSTRRNDRPGAPGDSGAPPSKHSRRHEDDDPSKPKTPDPKQGGKEPFGTTTGPDDPGSGTIDFELPDDFDQWSELKEETGTTAEDSEYDEQPADTRAVLVVTPTKKRSVRRLALLTVSLATFLVAGIVIGHSVTHSSSEVDSLEDAPLSESVTDGVSTPVEWAALRLEANGVETPREWASISTDPEVTQHASRNVSPPEPGKGFWSDVRSDVRKVFEDIVHWVERSAR